MRVRLTFKRFWRVVKISHGLSTPDPTKKKNVIHTSCVFLLFLRGFADNNNNTNNTYIYNNKCKNRLSCHNPYSTRVRPRRSRLDERMTNGYPTWRSWQLAERNSRSFSYTVETVVRILTAYLNTPAQRHDALDLSFFKLAYRRRRDCGRVVGLGRADLCRSSRRWRTRGSRGLFKITRRP